jgi:hypothetical protein
MVAGGIGTLPRSLVETILGDNGYTVVEVTDGEAPQTKPGLIYVCRLGREEGDGMQELVIAQYIGASLPIDRDEAHHEEFTVRTADAEADDSRSRGIACGIHQNLNGFAWCGLLNPCTVPGVGKIQNIIERP